MFGSLCDAAKLHKIAWIVPGDTCRKQDMHVSNEFPEFRKIMCIFKVRPDGLMSAPMSWCPEGLSTAESSATHLHGVMRAQGRADSGQRCGGHGSRRLEMATD